MASLLIGVLGVMGGFGYQIRSLITDTEGEIQIKARGSIAEYRDAVKKIEAVPGVAGATPYAAGVLMVQFNHKPAFPQMRGLDVASINRVVPLGKFVRLGSLDDLDDDSVILRAAVWLTPSGPGWVTRWKYTRL